MSGARAALAAAALGLAALAAGCGQAGAWRELAPPGLSLRFALPCRPDVEARRLVLAAVSVEWRLYRCRAAGAVFALAAGELGDPVRVDAALAELGTAARTHIGGRIERDGAAAVAGATPYAGARRWRFVGRLPDGAAVVEEVAVFAYGARVYQATVVGARPDPAQVRAFFDALQIRPAASEGAPR